MSRRSASSGERIIRNKKGIEVALERQITVSGRKRNMRSASTKAVYKNIRGDAPPCIGGANWKHQSIGDVMKTTRAGAITKSKAPRAIQVQPRGQKCIVGSSRGFVKYIGMEVGDEYDCYTSSIEEDSNFSLVDTPTIRLALTTTTVEALYDVQSRLSVIAKV